MAAGDIYACTIVQACNDTRFANLVHFRQESGSNSPDPKADLAELIEDGFIPQLKTTLSVQWIPRCVHVRQVGLAGQDFFRRNFAAETGDIIGEALPTDVCAVLQMLTAQLGRGSTGRLFLSGVAQSSEEDNCVTMTMLQTMANPGNWLAAQQAGTAHTWRAGLLRPGPVFQPFVEGQPRSALTVLKSRKPDFAC